MIHRPFLIRRVVATTAAFIILATVLTTLLGAPAWAAGSNMPWEQPLNQILQSVEGPGAQIMAVIISSGIPASIRFQPLAIFIMSSRTLGSACSSVWCEK